MKVTIKLEQEDLDQIRLIIREELQNHGGTTPDPTITVAVDGGSLDD